MWIVTIFLAGDYDYWQEANEDQGAMEEMMNEVLDQVDEIYKNELSVHFEAVAYQKFTEIGSQEDIEHLINAFRTKMRNDYSYPEHMRDLAFLFTGQDYAMLGGTINDQYDGVSRLSDPENLAYSVGMMINGSSGHPASLLEKTIIMAHEIGHQFSPDPGWGGANDHDQGWIYTGADNKTHQSLMWGALNAEILEPCFTDGAAPWPSSKNNWERFLMTTPREYLPVD